MTKTTDTHRLLSDGISTLLENARSKVRLLFLGIAVPAFTMVVYLGLHERNHVLDDHQNRSQSILDRVAGIQAERITATEKFLTALADAPAVRDPADPACSAYLSDVLALMPRYINLGVPSANGDLLCNASSLPEPVNVADRPYIRNVLKTHAFTIGRVQLDRAARVASLNFAYPVYADDAAGEIVGAAVAVVSLDWWGAELAHVNLPEGAIAIIFDSTGETIATFPTRADRAGAPALSLPPERIAALLQNARHAQTDTEDDASAVQIHTGTDGIRRVFASRFLIEDAQNDQIIMSLGLPVDAAIANANNRLLLEILFLGGGLFGIWWLTAAMLDRKILIPMRAMNSDIKRIEMNGAQVNNDAVVMQWPAMQDVTQGLQRINDARVQAQNDRQIQAEQMLALIGALPDTYFRIDQDSRILECHSGNVADLLTDPENFIGKRVSEVLPPPAAAQFAQNLEKHLATRQIVTWDYQLDFDTHTEFFEARLCHIAGSTELIAVVRNVSDRRIAEQRRQIAETRMAQVIANLPGVTISAETTKTGATFITFVSQQAETIWGYTPDEIYADIGLLTGLAPVVDLSNHAEKLWNEGQPREISKHIVQTTTRDGATKWLELHASATRLADGRIHSDIFTLDVSETIATQAQLETQRELAYRAQKHESIGRLTGGIAHDFNNLLAIIMGNLELLRDELRDEDHHKMIDAGIDASIRGARLTRSMLSFASKARLVPEILDLNKVVTETRNWAGRTLPATISVETSLLAGLWKIKADASSTESALLNLILNARDAMPDGGKLTLETANIRIDQSYADKRGERLLPGRYVMLAVTDTGTGIAPNILVQIFEPFFTTKGPAAGSGLGLSMVHGFMRQSGGTVQVYSEPGVGTTFKLYFKAVSGPLDPEHAAAPLINQAHLRGRRILVVEDEPEVLSAIVTTLEKAGYHVTPAASGDAARAIFEAAPQFDLLLTDIVMPGVLQGTTLSKVLRQTYTDLPVVFMSGYASEATVHGNGLRPEDIRLMKPVRRADLLAAISASLKG